MPQLRDLPSVDQVLRNINSLLPKSLLTEEVRTVLAERREAIQKGRDLPDESVENEVIRRLDTLLAPSLRPVINATGVVLHTNLGRSPLGDFQPITGCSNLEFDLATGKRGKRDIHTAPLLRRLLNRPGIVVNNNAAAVYLVLHELAAGSEVIISRGELIEIGDGFRIPEIMARSGAHLREVGTTNRTHIEDYRAAITDRTRLIMRVHPSNFHITGFTSRPSLDELAALAQASNIPLYEDLGSGCIVDLRSAGIQEPLVQDSLEAGVNILSFSCDKLLGGPQSGIIAGDKQLVERVRRNFMYRALRVDKLVVECLERTLRNLLLERWADIPALAAIFTPLSVLRERANAVASALAGLPLCVRDSESPIGGGSTPDQTLPTCVIAIEIEHADKLAAQLRQCPKPVIARIEHDQVIIDLRTVSERELPDLTDTLRKCLTHFVNDDHAGQPPGLRRRLTPTL